MFGYFSTHTSLPSVYKVDFYPLVIAVDHFMIAYAFTMNGMVLWSLPSGTGAWQFWTCICTYTHLLGSSLVVVF